MYHLYYLYYILRSKQYLHGVFLEPISEISLDVISVEIRLDEISSDSEVTCITHFQR